MNIPTSAVTKSRKRTRSLLAASVLGIGLSILTPIASASIIGSDTFDIVVVGFNASGTGGYLTTAVDATFGTTQNFTGDALGSQNLTVASSEVIGATTTTDFFSITVPTNFDPAGNKVGGSVVATMEMDLGGYVAGSDTVDLSLPIDPAGLSETGYIIYSGGTVPLNPGANVTLSNGDQSLADAEGVSAGAGIWRDLTSVSST